MCSDIQIGFTIKLEARHLPDIVTSAIPRGPFRTKVNDYMVQCEIINSNLFLTSI